LKHECVELGEYHLQLLQAVLTPGQFGFYAGRAQHVVGSVAALARKSSVAIEDLADETFVTFPRDEGTTIYPQIVRLCREAGFEPKIGMEAREASTLMGLVAAGCGISILPELFNCIQITDVVFRPLRGPKATTKLMIANRGDEHFPLVDAFLGTAVDIARVGR
jgi:DNA-binding transcriptional LysR family regulator